MTNETTTLPVTPAQRRWRIALVATGLLLLAVGGIVLVNDVAPTRYLGIVTWFAGAIILHDGILAPIVLGFSLLLRRTGRRIPLAVLLIVQTAIVVGAIVGFVVVPEIAKKSIGRANPTLLPLDYGLNLALFYGALVLVTALAVGVYLRVAARRQKLRSPIVQA
jgi:hypothetical protein